MNDWLLIAGGSNTILIAVTYYIHGKCSMYKYFQSKNVSMFGIAECLGAGRTVNNCSHYTNSQRVCYMQLLISTPGLMINKL